MARLDNFNNLLIGGGFEEAFLGGLFYKYYEVANPIPIASKEADLGTNLAYLDARGFSGFDGPTQKLQSTTGNQQHGDKVVGKRYTSNPITLPLILNEDLSHATDTLMNKIFDPAGISLRTHQSDGSNTRTIFGDALTVPARRQRGGVNQRMVIRLRPQFPFWLDDDILTLFSKTISGTGTTNLTASPSTGNNLPALYWVEFGGGIKQATLTLSKNSEVVGEFVLMATAGNQSNLTFFSPPYNNAYKRIGTISTPSQFRDNFVPTYKTATDTGGWKGYNHLLYLSQQEQYSLSIKTESGWSNSTGARNIAIKYVASHANPY